MEVLAPTRCREIRDVLLDGPQDFAGSWSGNRTVVPLEEVEEVDGSMLLSALASLSPDLICLTTEDLGPDTTGQGVVARPTEVSDWRWEFAPFDVVIATPDLVAALLLSVDEFALVGGPRAVVETALGKPISQAMVDFREYATEMSSASRHLTAVADRYQ